MDTAKLKEQIKSLPAGPGIYIFKNGKNKPLYIGKALNLKNRVKSYLKTDDVRLTEMIFESEKIEFKRTDSEIEALLLESQHIKKYTPPFNIMLRDDKQYGFVGFSEEKYPKIFITHQPDNNFKFKILNSKLKSAKADFIGPFTDIGALRTTLNLLRKIFPYCTCKQAHNNYCLNYHIGKCPGFCCLKQENPNLKFKIQNSKLYERNIRAIKNILSGKKSSLIKDLEKEMKIMSGKQEFEKALELQYKIEKIKRVFENAEIIHRQKTDNTEILNELKNLLHLPKLPERIECYDVANIQGEHAVGVMVVFSAQGGPASGGTVIVPDKNEYRKFKIYGKDTPDDTAMLKESLARRFNHPEWPYPDLIIIDGGKGQLNTAKEVLRITNNELRIMVIALTKNEHHIGHKILTESGEEISLSRLSTPLKNLLLHLDSEAHRFAISYYRYSHKKSLLK